MMKLKLQNRTGEDLFLAIAHKMNRNTVGTFFKTLEEVATQSSLSDKIGNVFNIDLSGIQINNKPVSVITGNEPKNIHVLPSRKKSVDITVIVCCDVPGQFLPSALSNIQRRQ